MDIIRNRDRFTVELTEVEFLTIRNALKAQSSPTSRTTNALLEMFEGALQ
jgi:hypothetical protein